MTRPMLMVLIAPLAAGAPDGTQSREPLAMLMITDPYQERISGVAI